MNFRFLWSSRPEKCIFSLYAQVYLNNEYSLHYGQVGLKKTISLYRLVDQKNEHTLSLWSSRPEKCIFSLYGQVDLNNLYSLHYGQVGLKKNISLYCLIDQKNEHTLSRWSRIPEKCKFSLFIQVYLNNEYSLHYGQVGLKKTISLYRLVDQKNELLLSMVK